MNKILSFVFCILFLSHSALGDFSFDSVVSISGKDDVTRVYSNFKTNNLFMFLGASSNGSISGTNGNYTFDSSLFYFQSIFGSFPILNWNYYHGASAFTLGGPFSIDGSAVASAYVPTYVLEYVESNGIDGLQIGEEKVVGFINLARLTYDIDIESETFGSGDDQFKVYHASVTSDNGVFQMNFTFSDRAVSVDGNKISAEQTKIDIGIYNYYDSNINKKTGLVCLLTDKNCPTTGPSSQNSSLALASFFASANLAIDIEGDGQISVATGDSKLYAGFSYASNAKVSREDDDSVTVNANVYTNVTGGGEDYGLSAVIETQFTGKVSHKFIVQSFEGIRPNTVEYDPTFGGASAQFQENNNNNNNSGFKVASSFALVALTALLALLL